MISIFIPSVKANNFASLIALAVLLVYALIKPFAPSFIPPKYLTTITKIFDSLLLSNTFKIGIPAVPPGSPSSDDFL